MRVSQTTKGQRALAWAVHAYTASGFVLAAAAAVFVVQGGSDDLRLALVCIWGAGVVDATDGWLARKAGVAKVLPHFDGRRLDDLVDFHTYVSIPLLLLWRAGVPGDAWAWVLLLPLMAGAYGFSQTEAKTEDGYFLGFPSYWNVVAFYLFFLAPPTWVSVLILVAVAVLTFVPIPYLYPSMGGVLNRLVTLLGVAWALLVVMILLDAAPRVTPGAQGRGWVLVSLAYPLLYLGASWGSALARRPRGRPG